MKIKPLYVILGILLLIVLVGGCGFNGMKQQSLEVDNTWAKVQSAYQRRADLIPNLVATVKGAAEFEKSTYVEVANARSGNLKSLTEVSADKLTPQRLADIEKASNDAQSAARMAIHVAFEQYPQLRATVNFQSLQDQLEGTENRIKTSRDDFNDAVKNYNYKVSSFPNNILASLFHFKERPMFQADQGAEKAPQVKF